MLTPKSIPFHVESQRGSEMSRRTETIVFVAITLALAYSLGAAFILTRGRYPLIIHPLMCMPGAVALTLIPG
jgi:hypothetical protein